MINIKELCSLWFSYDLYLLELGAGWAPAVLDNTEELVFIHQCERRAADKRSYWIGGLAYDTVESQGNSSGKPKEIR